MSNITPETRREGRDFSDSHLREAQILRYLEGTLNENEAEIVQAHLDSCRDCFDLFSTAVKYSLNPPTAAEVAEFEQAYQPDHELVLKKLFAKPATRAAMPKPERKSWMKILAQKFLPEARPVRRWQPAFAWALSLLILAVGSWQGVKFYRTTYQVSQAGASLLANHRIYIENSRLSGGYASKGIFKMSGEESQELAEPKSRLQRAIQNGAQSARARQLLAQIFIIEEKYAAADSLLSLLDPNAQNSAAWLNDVGVLYHRKKNWERAAHYFEAAIAAGEDLPEARYNLALVKLEMGARDEAIAILDDYVRLETNEGWKNAAASLRNRLIDQPE